MSKSESRYERVSRRAVLKGSLGIGAIALVPSLGCGGSNDAAVFAGSVAGQQIPTTEPVAAPVAETAAPTVAEQPTVEADPPTPEPATAEPVQVDPTAIPALASAALPAGASMVVDFSYVQSSGGKNVPPYLAVWVEDSNGELVETIELWYQQDRKGPRWLPDLKRWYSVDTARIQGGGVDSVDVVSGATRLAGAYSVAWNGSVGGALAPADDYFICIESARERGPYSLIREPISLNGNLFERALGAQGELQSAKVVVRV